MNCAEFEARLQTIVDARRGGDSASASAAADLLDHASDCEACRRLWDDCQWDDERVFADAVSAWRVQVPAVALADRVLVAYGRDQAAAEPAAAEKAALEKRSVELFAKAGIENAAPIRGIVPRPAKSHVLHRRGLIRSRGALLAALASLAALFAMLFNVPRMSTRDGSWTNSLTSTLPDQNRTTADRDRNGEVQQLVRDAGTAYLTFAREAAGAVGDIASLVVPEAPASPLDVGGITMGLEGTWGDGLGRQVKPIGDSLGDAFHFLWEAARARENSAT